MKKISPAAIIALKDALTNIYWTKKNLRHFITFTIENSKIISTIDWENNYKYHSVSELIDRMVDRPEIYEKDLLHLFKEVCEFSDFNHLKRWDNSKGKIEKAKSSVIALKEHAHGHFEILEERKEAEKRRQAAKEKREESKTFQKRLEALQQDFMKIAGNTDYQERGYQLESFLNELFILVDLDPKSSFKITSEQIDGAFTFDNNDYLLEAKWQKGVVRPGELHKFAGKLSGKLKNTLGLFISIEGFSDSYKSINTEGIRSMILMDGQDLNAVLENRIDLNDMLYRKRRHASETGDIYLTINQLLS